MAEKPLIVVVEGTAVMGPFWRSIVHDFPEKIIRGFYGNKVIGVKHQTSSSQWLLIGHMDLIVGYLFGPSQGQPEFITRLEDLWKSRFPSFPGMTQHGFLGQLRKRKLVSVFMLFLIFSVIQLPSQTLLLSVSSIAHCLLGILFSWGSAAELRPRLLDESTRASVQGPVKPEPEPAVSSLDMG